MKNLILILSILSTSAFSMDVNEIVKKTHLNSYYKGDDGKAQMLMKVYSSKDAKPVKKLFYMLRLDLEDGGEQLFYTYFIKPTDIKRTTFLVHKKIKGDDYRRLYIPTSDKVLAIAGSRKQDPFMGSDYSYEDVSGRHFTRDNHTLLGEEKLDGEEVYKTQSIPKVKEDKISKIIAWISKDKLIATKVEYYNHSGKVFRRFIANEIGLVDGLQTVIAATMYSPIEGSYTEMTLNPKKTKYNIGLTKDLFSERSLKNPPMKYFK